MKFSIKRSSDWSHNTRPCDEAVTDKPDEVWDKEWKVEIDSLDALWQFVIKYGRVIVSNESSTVGALEERPHLEIYDDYRE